MFEGFKHFRLDVNGTFINGVSGGSGPALLLLHGYPQSHVIWHKVAPRLAARFSVVATDLRGYGDSGKLDGGGNHEAYSKRVMARDQVEVMAKLGFDRFAVVGHDRGGRVAHRLTLDHENAVSKLVVLDISPTRIMYAKTNHGFAQAYYHWYFLTQPAPLPERLIGGDPEFYLLKKIGSGKAGLSPFTPEALAHYIRYIRNPEMVHGSCEDYRAAAGIDLEHDAADEHRKLSCPVLALWGAHGVVHRFFDPVADWKSVAEDVRGKPLPCGHYIPEEVPDLFLEEAVPFLKT